MVLDTTNWYNSISTKESYRAFIQFKAEALKKSHENIVAIRVADISPAGGRTHNAQR